MSKLSKRVDELEYYHKYHRDEIDTLQKQVATLQKQMSCDCSRFEVVQGWNKIEINAGFVDSRLFWGSSSFYAYSKKCLDCGLETVYESEEAAMKDKDALLKIEIDRLTAERKGLKK